MNDLSNTNVLIMVFAMKGCPACEAYQPRLETYVTSFINAGHPFMFYADGIPILPRQIPVLVLDSTSDDPEIQALMDQHEIKALPSTIFMTRQRGNTKLEGDLGDQGVYDMLVQAVQSNG